MFTYASIWTGTRVPNLYFQIPLHFLPASQASPAQANISQIFCIYESVSILFVFYFVL